MCKVIPNRNCDFKWCNYTTFPRAEREGGKRGCAHLQTPFAFVISRFSRHPFSLNFHVVFGPLQHVCSSVYNP